MVTDTLLDHSSETHKIEAFYKALKLVGEMDVKPAHGESWFDDMYYADHCSEYGMQNDEGWMDDLDDLDEAA